MRFFCQVLLAIISLSAHAASSSSSAGATAPAPSTTSWFSSSSSAGANPCENREVKTPELGERRVYMMQSVCGGCVVRQQFGFGPDDKSHGCNPGTGAEVQTFSTVYTVLEDRSSGTCIPYIQKVHVDRFGPLGGCVPCMYCDNFWYSLNSYKWDKTKIYDFVYAGPKDGYKRQAYGPKNPGGYVAEFGMSELSLTTQEGYLGSGPSCPFPKNDVIIKYRTDTDTYDPATGVRVIDGEPQEDPLWPEAGIRQDNFIPEGGCASSSGAYTPGWQSKVPPPDASPQPAPRDPDEPPVPPVDMETSGSNSSPPSP
jgi:hypothetical protein